MPIITQFNIMRRVPLPMLEGQSLAVYYCICVFVLCNRGARVISLLLS